MKIKIGKNEIMYHRHNLNTERAYYQIRAKDNPNSKTAGIQEALDLAYYVDVPVTVDSGKPLTLNHSVSLPSGIYHIVKPIRSPK